MKTRPLFISLTLGLGLTLALLWLLCDSATPVTAAPVERPLSDATHFHYVATTGTDSGDCSTPISACLTIQYAVDQAGTGDEIRVASGVYTDVQNVPSLNTGTFTATQIVVITKSVTIRGGYTTTNDFADPPDPMANPTTLDAQGQEQGRVIFITGDISPTVEGLRITGGNAAGLGGGQGGGDAGGGVYVIIATATLSDNEIFGNTADYGGGLYLYTSAAELSANTIHDNTTEFDGGGLYLYTSAAELSANTIHDNMADSGGGLYLERSVATLSANTITANTANGTRRWNGGGGLYLDSSDAALTNTVVADNQANSLGSGLYILDSSPHLLHTTIARNGGGDGSGLYVTAWPGSYSSVALTNTILAGHTVGITVTTGNTATLESTLWGSGAWANGADTGGAGTIITGTRNFWGDPDFVDPDGGNYHIGLGSAAIDLGVDAGVTADMDGESRLIDTPDLGADEFRPTLEVTKEDHPDPVHAGAQLTYTLRITNIGHVDLHATITDTLPTHVTPSGTLTWTPPPIAPGKVFTQPVVVTVNVDYAGPLTNVVQVTTDEGAAGVYTETSTSVNCFVRLNDEPTLYTAVQAAVDASTQPTDVVKVAGYCSAINTYGGPAQVAYISKMLTVRGGYTTTNWTTSDPVANPTTLDAQGQGRVLYITGDISPTVEGLRITGGDADGLGGDPSGDDAGGGVYVITATAAIRDNQMFSNTADRGGGLFLGYSNATLRDNTVTSNIAGGGGGLFLDHSNAALNDNTVISNTAEWGGGLYLKVSDATLSDNTIQTNTAITNGGGLYLFYSDATLSSNTIQTNTATTNGGGLYLEVSDAKLSGNILTSNTAEWGGGLFLKASDATLTNSVVADNQANIAGSGLFIEGSLPRLLHTTIARNGGGDGSGVYVTDSSSVALANTILVSHTVGISVTSGNTITANGILWYSTPITISQDTEATVTVQNQYQGDPAFDADGYHLTAGSAAIDKGVVDTGVTVDIDGGSRPAGTYPDLGADEFPAALGMTKESDQTVLSGSDVTFTITVSNTGYMDLSNVTATDVEVPDCEQTIGDLGVGISTTYTCTVATVTTSFTNTATVTGTSSAGTVTDTDTATVTVADIEITKEPDQTVVSGSDATFTITVSNTGGAALTDVEVTDALAPNCARTIGGLDATESISYTCPVTNVTASFTNTATVTGTSPAGTVTDTNTATVTVADIEITKEPDQTVVSGSDVTFTITITNIGDVDLTDVTVTDAEVPDCEQTVGGLDATESTSYTCQVATVTASFTNTATVTGTSPAGTVTDTDTATVTVADIEIAKTPDTQMVVSGSDVTFTITVTNVGDTALTDLQVTDALAPDCARTIGDPGVGISTTYTCTVSAVTASFTNTATVTGTSSAGTVADTDTATVTVADIQITKEPDQTVQSGSDVTFTITITNVGDLNLTDVIVTDAEVPDCEQTVGGLDATESTSYTCQVAAVTASFTNTATVTGTSSAGTVTDTDTAMVTVADIQITKTPDTQMVISGSDVTFTITVTNTGEVILAPITVTDALAPDCEQTFVSLGVGARESYTCIRPNVTADFTNTATVTGTPPTGDDVTDTDTAFVDVISPTIEIAKTPDTQTVVRGSGVTFTITIANTGDVPLTPITVTDALAPDCGQTFVSLDVGASESYTCMRLNVTSDFTNTATVTGTSLAGMVTDTDTAMVNVEEIIVGLTATNDSPTPLGRATTLTATITAGSNVVYTWAFGHDGATGSGAVVTHIYPAVGVYTAVVTASNSVSLLRATTVVTITDESINGLSATNDSPTPLGRATTLTATITAGSNVTYTWAFGHDGATGSGAVAAHTYPAIDTYTAIVTASNSVSLLTSTTTVTIVEAPILNFYLPIILKNYTPPSVPPTETPTPTATGTLPPTATPTPTATPPPTGPDLVVTDISVVPSSPEAGQPATVYVTVRNQGNQAVAFGNNFYVDFYVKNQPTPPQPLERGDIQWGVQGSWFGAGESRTLNGSYVFTAGTHQLYAQADTDETVTETNENNNVLGPEPLNVTGLGGGEAPVGPVVIPTRGGGSPRPTPTPEP